MSSDPFPNSKLDDIESRPLFQILTHVRQGKSSTLNWYLSQNMQNVPLLAMLTFILQQIATAKLLSHTFYSIFE